MRIDVRLDREQVPIGQSDTVAALLRLTAPTDRAATSRPRRAVVVALDRSSSMQGERMAAATLALERLLGQLAPDDVFGVVAFGDSASVVVPARPVGPGDRAAVLAALSGLRARGSTDLGGGLRLALSEADRVADRSGAAVLLISDGYPSRRTTDAGDLAAEVAQAVARGITLATIGVGLGCDEELLVALAQAGAGSHRFAATVEEVLAAMAEVTAGVLSAGALGTVLRVTPNPVVAASTRAGTLPAGTWHRGTLTVPLGDLRTGEVRIVLLEVSTRALAEARRLPLLDAEATATGLPGLEPLVAHADAWVESVDSARVGLAPTEPEVRAELAILAAQTHKAEAARLLAAGESAAAAAVLARALDLVAAAPTDAARAEIDALTALRQAALTREPEYAARLVLESWDRGSRGLT